MCPRAKVKCLTPLSSLSDVSGEEWWSHHESRILFHNGNSNLHRQVFSSDLRSNIRDCRSRKWPDLGHRISATSRTQRHRCWRACDWGEWAPQFHQLGCPQPCYITGRCRRPCTRRRFVPEVPPPFFTLTCHPQGTPTKPINTVLPLTPSSASTWFCPTAQSLM